MTTLVPYYDCVILGGGMMGLSLALALAQLPANRSMPALRLLVVDPGSLQPPPCPQSPYTTARVSAINHSSQQLLQQLDIWSRLTLSPYRCMQIWDSHSQAQIAFNAADAQQTTLGHIVFNDEVIAALLQALQTQAQVTLMPYQSLSSLGPVQSGQRRLYLGTHSTPVQTALLIGADGAHSMLRNCAGISTAQYACNQQAIVAVVTLQQAQAHHCTAHQVFLPTGPVALLPLPDQRQYALVWSMHQHSAKALVALDDQAFCQRLSQVFHWERCTVTAVSPRQSFPLQQLHAQQYIQSHLALLGDAAHSIHPLAGLGANLGWSDIAVLQHCIAQGRRQGQSPGDWALLKRYQRRRKVHNAATLLTLHALNQLFCATHLPLRYLRAQGMTGLHRCIPLKQRLLRYALQA